MTTSVSQAVVQRLSHPGGCNGHRSRNGEPQAVSEELPSESIQTQQEELWAEEEDE